MALITSDCDARSNRSVVRSPQVTEDGRTGQGEAVDPVGGGRNVCARLVVLLNTCSLTAAVGFIRRDCSCEPRVKGSVAVPRC